jgi:hypothetical protein
VNRAPEGVPVVIHLYQDSIIECQILNKIFDELAQKHPKTKFLRSVATKCVENMVDKDVPALFFYKDGELLNALMRARDIFGGTRMTTKTVEYILSMQKMIEMEFDFDPRDKLKLINTSIIKGKNAGRHHEDDVDSDGDDDREYTTNQYQRYQQTRY